MLLVLSGLALVPTSASAAPCDEPVDNPVLCENSKPGNDGWELGNPSSGIEGFATDISVNKGETVGFKVDTAASDYRLDIYRLGYYQGLGGRLVDTVTPSAPLPQSQPQCLTDPATGLIDCGNWEESASWDVPNDAASGVYLAKLVRTDGQNQANHIVFVVRDDSSDSDLLVQTSDTTWAAYNTWGGNSLYQGQPAGRAYKVSYNRPFVVPDEDWLFSAEYPMIRFLEANGYDASYTTGVDTHRRGDLLTNHETFVSVGHDEYWSGQQRANVEAARDAGVNLAFFSGNEVFWKTRWESSIDAAGTPMRTLVSYKETKNSQPLDPAYDQGVWTGTWRDARFSPPGDGGRPENALTGTMFMVNGAPSRADAIKIPAADGKMRFWRGTSVASLGSGQTATLPNGTLGYEWDVAPDNGFRPPGLVHLSTATYDISGDYLLDDGATYGNGTATHHLTQYRADSGALVFGAGTVQWAWGLDADWGVAADDRMQQATVNLLADMGAQPASLVSGLTPAQQSTDSTPPTSSVTSPAPASVLQTGEEVTISGTASDAGGGVVGSVEVSVDGGATWRSADGRESWTYTFTPSVEGPLTVQTRAADDSSNLETPGPGVAYSVGDAPPDTTAPTVVATTPKDGASDVSARTTVTATFDEAVAAGSVSWSVTGPEGPVNGSTRYTASTRTSSFDPDSPLALSTTYTARVSGAQDAAGNVMAPVSWSFTTAADDVAPPPVSGTIFGDAVPPGTEDPETGSVELGVKFVVDEPGFVTGVRFFKGSANTGTHVGNLWDSSGTLLASSTFTDESASGWQQVAFASAVAVEPGQTYVASYFAPNGRYHATSGFFAGGGAGSAPIRALADGVAGGNGVYRYGSSSGFPTSSWNASNYWVDATFTTQPGADTTSPSVSTTNPLDGAVDVAADVAVTATFDEQIDGATAAIAVATADGPVDGSTTYDAGSSTATFVPSSPLVGSTVHTVTIRNAEDAAGNVMIPVTFSFTTATVDLIPPSVTSTSPADGATGVPVGKTVTVTFDENVTAGSVSWSLSGPDGAVAGSTGYDGASRTASFDPTQRLDAETTYTATIDGARDPSGNVMSAVGWSFTTAPADGTPPSITVQNPPDATTKVPVDAAVTATFDEDLDPASVTMGLTGPGGSVAGTSQYDAGTRTATFVPAQPLPGGAAYTVSVSGEDLAGNALDPVPWSFTTLDVVAVTASIFGDAEPAGVADADTGSVELGMKFVVDEPGFVTGVRFFKGSANTGTHVGNLWDSSGTLLASATFTDESASGWQQVAFASAVAVEPGQTYVASYFAPNGRYHATSGFFAGGGAGSAPIRALADGVAGGNGVYRYGSSSGFPTSSWNSANYWVDAVYSNVPPDLTAPSVVATTPVDGVVGVDVTRPISATFSESVQPTIGFMLVRTADQASVVATQSYDNATRTVRLTPVAPLEPGTAYTATVTSAQDVAGNRLAEVVSWSFTAAADETPPTLSGLTPAIDAVDVPRDAAVTVTFDEAVVGSTIDIAVESPDGPVPGDVSYDASSRTATFRPEALLTGSTSHTVTVSGAEDPAGNRMQPVTWSFTTVAPDVTSPVVLATDPADGQRSVPPDAVVSATFDEDVVPASIGWTLDGPSGPVTGSASYDATTRTATFNPDERLASATEYTVTLTDVRDASGNASDPWTWSFTTADTEPPRVVGRSPEQGATDVARATAITAMFDEAVDEASLSVVVSSANGAVSGGNTYATATQSVTFQPADRLASGMTYTVTVAASDQAGNVMDPASWSFTTADTVAPRVTATTPADGATGVAVATTIAASFDEDVTSSGVSVAVVGAAGPVTGAIAYQQATRAVTFDAAQNLEFGQEYTVELTGAADTAGNVMDPVVWSFTTAAVPDTSPPVVVTTVPLDQATDVTADTALAATFDEEVDPASIRWEVTGPDGPVPGDATYDVGSLTAGFVPQSPLAPATEYSVTLRGAVDSSGNVMPDMAWSFETADVAPPTIESRAPVADATDVPVGTAISATFDEPISPGAVSIEVTQGTTSVDGTVSYDAASRTATFRPAEDLSSSTRYTVTAQAEDLAGNVMAAVTWSFTSADVEVPQVTGRTPATDAVDVAVDTNVTVTFSEAMSTPVSLALQRDTDGASVVATMSYDPVTSTATLQPATPLSGSTSYTVTVSGEDLAGNALDPVPWSFTTAEVVVLSIFGDAEPAGVADADTGSVELGVKFVVDEPGFVTGVRVFKGSANTGTHVGNLWDSSGTLLASATFTDESASGWQQVAFASPVAVEPGQTYVASYFAPNGRYHATSGFFAGGGAGSAPIRALADGVAGGNGVYRYGSSSGFPTSSWNSTNYWVDVSFTSQPAADTVRPAVTSTSPGDGAGNVVPASHVRATFSEPVAPGTLIWAVSGPQGPVGGTATYDDTARTAVFQPDNPLELSTQYSVLLTGGEDLAGNRMTDIRWQFTTADDAAGCPCSLWPDSVAPGGAADPDDNPIEVGVKFRSSVDGFITGIRFYKFAGNTGPHVGHLWDQQGNLLASATFANESASGWQQASLPAPLRVSAGQVYVASYSAPSGRYAATQDYFDGERVSGPLTAPAAAAVGGNGVYAYGGGTFPTDTYRNVNYWVDPVFDTTADDAVAPQVVTSAPEPGATDVSVDTGIRVTFNEPVQQPVPVSLRRTSDQASVTADVTYDPATRTATLVPWAPLDGLTEYTVAVAGVVDEAGNIAQPSSWSFTTWDPALNLDPTKGPNDGATFGPLLLVTSAANPSSEYLAEILRAEGLNHFAAIDVSQMTPARLGGFDAVVLGETDLTAAQSQALRDYVSGGGNLVAMRPDPALADLFGVASVGGTTENTYLRVVTEAGPGVGITGETIQFKGVADLYTLAGASPVADLYSTASQATTNPAVTVTSVGGSGGQAAMFTYDLARSIVLQRQGNPAWAGQERDGFSPIRSDDQYFGGATDPDWVDLSKVGIPQADEQQRLLANLLISMTADRSPMPRFFYLPNFNKAVIVGTGDDHANGGTAGRFDTYLANDPAGCDDSKWECPRFTSYVYPNTPLAPAAAASYEQAGFEVGTHITTSCQNYTQQSLGAAFANDLAVFGATYTGVRAPRTNRTHCLVWSDWVGTPQVSRANGIRLDTNYYYWPGDWVADRPGFMTGSGLPMRFADIDGTLVDVYQAATQMTDESGQSYPYTADTLLDRALGPEGYYGAFVTNHHTDYDNVYEDDTTLASAQARGVPVITAARLLDWTDGRNGSSFRDLIWTGDALTFDIKTAPGAAGITAMLPSTTDSRVLSGLSRAGQPVDYTLETVKGIEYAIFAGVDGAYVATYADLATGSTQQVLASGSVEFVPAFATSSLEANIVSAKSTRSADSSVSIADVELRTSAAGQVTLTWSTSAAVASEVIYGTDPYTQNLTARTASPSREHEVTLSGLDAGVTYYYTVVAESNDVRMTWPDMGEAPASFVGPATDSTSLEVASVEASPLPGVGTVLTWETGRATTAYVEFGHDPGALDRRAQTSEASTRGQLVLTGLERATSYHYRVTFTDAAGNQATYPSQGSPAAVFVSPVGGVGVSSVTSLRVGNASSVDPSSRQDGELRLSGSVSSGFDAARAFPGYIEDEDGRGKVSKVRGQLVLDGSRWVTTAALPVKRSLEATIQFDGQGNQAFGLAGSGTSNEFVGVVNRGGQLSAAVRDATGSWQYTPLPSSVRDLIGQPIDVRLEYRKNDVDVVVGGATAVTLPAPKGSVRPAAVDEARGDGELHLAWLRASSNAKRGTYASPTFDALQIVTWDRAFWDADLPKGTSLSIFVRTGPTSTPGTAWSAWAEVSGPGTPLNSLVPDSRFLQYRVELATNDTTQTPVLRHIGFSHNGDLELHGETGEGGHE